MPFPPAANIRPLVEPVLLAPAHRNQSRRAPTPRPPAASGSPRDCRADSMERYLRSVPRFYGAAGFVSRSGSGHRPAARRVRTSALVPFWPACRCSRVSTGVPSPRRSIDSTQTWTGNKAPGAGPGIALAQVTGATDFLHHAILTATSDTSSDSAPRGHGVYADWIRCEIRNLGSGLAR
jgi:hypothetical protein